MKNSMKSAFIAAGILRLISSLILAFFSVVIPINQCPEKPCSEVIYSGLINNGEISRLFLAPWYRWDTVHYLEMAQNGYNLSEVDNTNWPPFYPILISLFSRLVNPLVAALLISTISTFVMFFLLHQIVSEIWGEKQANSVLFLLAVFPTSFFLVSGYTESLFMTLALACIIYARQKKWILAGICGGLATLTRYQGIVLVVPLLWETYITCFKRSNIQWRQLVKPIVSFSIPPIVFGLNSAYIHFILKAPWPWVTRSEIWHLNTGWPLIGFIGNVLFLFANTHYIFYYYFFLSIFLDLILGIIFIVLVSYPVPKMPISYRLYGLATLLLSTTIITDFNTVTGISRFVLCIFPGFIALTFILNSRKKMLGWGFISLFIQQIILFCFYMGAWIA